MEGKRPEVIGGKRVTMACVKQHGTGTIQEVEDTTFRDSVLMVGVNPTVRNCLIRGVDGGTKLLGSKDAIIAMVVFDGDVVMLGKAFKCVFGRNGIVGRRGGLGVHIIQSRRDPRR